jgi:hypothetical protein
MITLTNPEQVKNSLGGSESTRVAYDKSVISQLTMAVDNIVNITLRITCSADTTQPPVSGTVDISIASPSASLQIPPLGISQKIRLSPTQIDTVKAIVNKAVADLEAALISTNLITGTQS